MQTKFCRDESSKTSSFRKGGSGQLSTKVVWGRTNIVTLQYVDDIDPTLFGLYHFRRRRLTTGLSQFFGCLCFFLG